MVFDIHRCRKSPDGNESRAYVCVYELEKVSKDKGKMGIAGDEKTAQKYNFGCNSFDKRNMALGFISQSRFVYSLTWPAVVSHVIIRFQFQFLLRMLSH